MRPLEMRVDVRAQFLQIDVRFRKIFAVGSFPFVEIRNGIEPQAVDAKAEPEIADLLHRSCTAGLSKFKSG